MVSALRFVLPRFRIFILDRLHMAILWGKRHRSKSRPTMLSTVVTVEGIFGIDFKLLLPLRSRFVHSQERSAGSRLEFVDGNEVYPDYGLSCNQRVSSIRRIGTIGNGVEWVRWHCPTTLRYDRPMPPCCLNQGHTRACQGASPRMGQVGQRQGAQYSGLLVPLPGRSPSSQSDLTSCSNPVDSAPILPDERVILTFAEKIFYRCPLTTPKFHPSFSSRRDVASLG